MFAPGRCLSKELLEQRPMLSVKVQPRSSLSLRQEKRTHALLM